MRNWITITEGAFDEKPSFTQAVTDDLVHEIITSGKWVDHGGDLEDWWDQRDEHDYFGNQSLADMLGEEDAKALMAKPWSEVRGLPIVKQMVINCLIATAEYYDQNLVLTGETWIYRGLCIPADATGFDRHQPLGRFWSTDKGQAYRFMDNQSIIGATTVLMMAQLKDCSVDWRETIRSRLDQFHGDEEEIQLEGGSQIHFHAQILDLDIARGKTRIKQIVMDRGSGYLAGTV